MLYERKKGILFILCSALFFALMSFFVRLSGDLPTMQKAFFRNAVAAVAAGIILFRSHQNIRLPKGTRLDMFFRCSFGGLALVLNFYAMDHLPISDANMLNKLSPFFAVITSVWVLKEKASTREWFYVFLAFFGALFVIKPTFHAGNIYTAAGAISGFGAGTAYTFVRKLGNNGVRGPLIVFCFSIFTTAFTLPFFILYYKPMETWQLLCLLIAGSCATVAQMSITKAYTCAPAKEISVFDYSQVIFAAILGYLFLHQLADVYSFIGYAIIITAAFLKWKQR